MDRIFELIRAERVAQDAQWGDQSGHTQEHWLAILTEETGETAKAVLERQTEEMRKELVQVAAVAVAWLEILEPKAVPRVVRVRPHGNDGCQPASPEDCPYHGTIACVSSSGGSICGSFAGGAGEDLILCDSVVEVLECGRPPGCRGCSRLFACQSVGSYPFK